MWMWYHSEINDVLLFKNFHIVTVNDMIIACVIFAFLAIALEALKWIRWRFSICHEENVEKNNTRSYCSRTFDKMNVLKTIFFSIQMIISYILMLVFMTFSIWLCLSVCIGISIGYFLFGNRVFNLPDKVKSTPKKINED
ncbi:Ctr copper transporter family-containing protein [Strongyloides ratti]|uniref:Copper transport protein n=1 Tax=Strongyloides ratti TaxID=34506 RepID=A0A090KUZ2_STRRB|nr:Ctr copper transporter family-containing protein [Strongyloides ratti]CEF61196.1 Ctr copper transporter family-containing protein [Strongyloides ratti]